MSAYSKTPSMADTELVTVTRAELEELRKLKADLPAIIAQAKEEENKDALKKLHQRDKENPEKHRARALKSYERNKDAINAKRREAYKRKVADKKAKESVALAVAN